MVFINIEIWKPIKKYEGLYEISSLGRVKSLNYNHTGKSKILKPALRGGYLAVSLFKNNNLKTFPIHRLVAIAFIPNPNNFSQVNHKNEQKTQNYVTNLEWCTQKYNVNYGTRSKRVSETMKGKFAGEKHPFYGKHHSEETKKKMSERMQGEKNPYSTKIICVTTNEEFDSISDAVRKYNIKNISACCRGERKSAGKHPLTGEKMVWKYAL